VSKRAQAFVDGRWADLHAAYVATVSDADMSAAVIARNNVELKRQESACAKVSEGARQLQGHGRSPRQRNR
jgi:hypothetical protein